MPLRRLPRALKGLRSGRSTTRLSLRPLGWTCLWVREPRRSLPSPQPRVPGRPSAGPGPSTKLPPRANAQDEAPRHPCATHPGEEGTASQVGSARWNGPGRPRALARRPRTRCCAPAAPGAGEACAASLYGQMTPGFAGRKAALQSPGSGAAEQPRRTPARPVPSRSARRPR